MSHVCHGYSAPKSLAVLRFAAGLVFKLDYKHAAASEAQTAQHASYDIELQQQRPQSARCLRNVNLAKLLPVPQQHTTSRNESEGVRPCRDFGRTKQHDGRRLRPTKNHVFW